MSALNRKLLRDLVAMKGQAFAIAMVVGAGVSMYVMYLSNFASLQGTRAAYYSQQRFADVFVAVKRAPERIAGEIAALPGVSAIETSPLSCSSERPPSSGVSGVCRATSLYSSVPFHATPSSALVPKSSQ